MNTDPKPAGKRVPKTLSLDGDVIRAAEAAVQAGLAENFSQAVEAGLELLLESEKYPTRLTETELERRLKVGEVMAPLVQGFEDETAAKASSEKKQAARKKRAA